MAIEDDPSSKRIVELSSDEAAERAGNVATSALDRWTIAFHRRPMDIGTVGRANRTYKRALALQTRLVERQ